LLVNRGDTEPLFNKCPNYYGKSTMHKEMCHRLRCSLSKWTKATLGQPLSSNLSAVHNLFLRACQVRYFVFGGAQTFQTILFLLVEIAPKNCALYAEAVCQSRKKSILQKVMLASLVTLQQGRR
jgi:hypothetical protein